MRLHNRSQYYGLTEKKCIYEFDFFFNFVIKTPRIPTVYNYNKELVDPQHFV